MAKKNVRKDIKEFRQKLGFKTRDLLMGNIEDYCRSNKEIKKIINEKTIQRMENDFFASDHTLKIYSAVLKVEVDQLLEKNQKNLIFKNENEIFSTSSSYVKRILNHKDLIEITQNCSKRKFIMDFNEDNLVYGQNEGIKHAIEFIDKSTLATKGDLTTLIEDDDFGNQEKNKVNKDYQVCLNETIKGLEKGNQWISWDEVEDITRGSLQGTKRPETDAEEMMKWIPSESKNKYQIYTHGAKIFFDTFWPFEEFYFKKNIINKGVFSNKIFDPKKEKRIDAPGETIYDPHGVNNYILVPVRLYYSIIIFSSRPSIDSINIKNNVGNIIASDLMNEGNEKILYKKFNSTFNQVINDLSNRDIYPKNYLDETDINIIYAKDKFIYDADDYLYTLNELSEKCRDEILADNKFYNLVKFLNKGSFKREFNIEDNIDYNSRKKWLEKYNEFDFLLEDIKQIFGYHWQGKEINETIEKVKNIFLEAGDNLSKELKKTTPITELP